MKAFTWKWNHERKIHLLSMTAYIATPCCEITYVDWVKVWKIFTNKFIESCINIQNMTAHFHFSHVDRSQVLSQPTTTSHLPEASSISEEHNCEPNALFQFTQNNFNVVAMETRKSFMTSAVNVFAALQYTRSR